MSDAAWTIRIEVANHVGVLERVAAVFAERGLNIESVTAGSTRILLEVRAPEDRIRYVARVLERLDDVERVRVSAATRA